jgi:hypothetical protein
VCPSQPTEGRNLEAGQKVRDAVENRTGVILDVACQYAHPKAQPVFSYLIRWQDGQVQALSEHAFIGDRGLEPLE